MGKACSVHERGCDQNDCPACILKVEKEQIRAALAMVLGSTLMEADGHDWRTCEQPSCMIARRYVTEKDSIR